VIDKAQFMPDVIDFLERMGQDAALRHAPEAVLEQAMREAQMSLRARAALTSGSRAAIKAVVGAENNVCCCVVDDNVCCLMS
jgi:hypothetical protein